MITFSPLLAQAAASFRDMYTLDNEGDTITMFETDMHDALHHYSQASPDLDDEVVVESLEYILHGYKTINDYSTNPVVTRAYNNIPAHAWDELTLAYTYYKYVYVA